MTFVLDDVRESFTNDLTRFLGEIERGSKAVASAATLAVPPERTWLAPINAMVVGLHGIHGSSSLIGVSNLAQSAKRLEDIASLANESVRMMRAHANRLKLIAHICLEGSSDLRVILEHELAGQVEEAKGRFDRLDQQLDVITKEIDAQLSVPETVEPDYSSPMPMPSPIGKKLPPLPVRPGFTPVPTGHTPVPSIPAVPRVAAPTALAAPSSAPAPKDTTDDGWEDTLVGAPPPRPPAVALSPDDELAMVFQTEAREALTNLRGYLTRLEHQPNDREAATQCARLFHLLKGAAASVGFDQIAVRAQALHTEVEQLRSDGIESQAIAQLRVHTEAFIAFAVPDLAVAAEPAVAQAQPAGAEAGGSAESEPAEIFREEAQSAIDEIRAMLRSIRETSGTVRGVMTSRIERLLHRLKGSALIVGAASVAAVASRGQALCEALDRVDPVALGNVVEQLGTMLVPAGDAAAPPMASVVRINLPPRDEWDSYLEESQDILDSADRTLGMIEDSPRPSAELSNLFRNYHTLKGASNAVGLTPVGQHLHIIETFLERLVAAPKIEDLRGIVRALTEQNDAIRRNISRANSEAEVSVDHERVQAVLGALSAERGSGASWIAANDSAWSAERSDLDRVRPRRRKDPESRASGSGAEHVSGPASEHASEHRGDTEVPATERRFIRVPADRLDNLLDLAGELVVCRSRMLSRVGRIHDLQEDGQVRHETMIQLVDTFAAQTQFTNLDGRRRRLGTATATTDGVLGFGSLELDQYEEIHVLSRRLDESASDVNEVRREIEVEMVSLTEDAEMLSTIASGLQSEITRARMLTLDTLFTRLRLPIRDAAQRGGREVEIVTVGEQLAIDKSMSDALYAPLLHMVRNAVAHGIEAPDTRLERGKPREGTIRITASQEHGEIVLEIADDGRGVDFVKLRDVGVARRMIPADTDPSDPRVADLIFAKGVSTLDGADDVAGRGLGGNVVKRAVDRLNGTIQLRSQTGVGTVFRITLPLSMSITQAVLVRVGGVLLAIPIAYAETILAREVVELVDSFGRVRARIADKMVPVHQTRRIFDERMLKSPPTDKVIVVCSVGGERVAVQVDEIVGQEEIVVKSLGLLLDGHPLFSGSTSRGDGELALILDVPGVLEAESVGERRRPVVQAMDLTPTATPKRQLPEVRPADDVVEDVQESAAHEVYVESEVENATPVATGIELSEVVAIPVGRLRVLFVDDSLSVRKVAERMLASLDVDVIAAVDGLDALEKLRSMAFSLVFTDLEMPRMHGFELIREMQMLPAYRAIPVVVISSRSGQKHIDQALSMGAREYLTKPFSPEILNGVLDRLARMKGP